ncbi:hypothetical protein SADUNF_Sadunf15G0037700 [Salix dunnii]|uniref:Uncharacterized protein n=1 Tax=Salix dunnii TaxID=1413687 RepID=A0A835JDT4_9ROSI|nr:hypothetical protein SADUNF_Sadunf15G0037700 [Salix dunnii]
MMMRFTKDLFLPIPALPCKIGCKAAGQAKKRFPRCCHCGSEKNFYSSYSSFSDMDDSDNRPSKQGDFYNLTEKKNSTSTEVRLLTKVQATSQSTINDSSTAPISTNYGLCSEVTEMYESAIDNCRVYREEIIGHVTERSVLYYLDDFSRGKSHHIHHDIVALGIQPSNP